MGSICHPSIVMFIDFIKKAHIASDGCHGTIGNTIAIIINT